MASLRDILNKKRRETYGGKNITELLERQEPETPAEGIDWQAVGGEGEAGKDKGRTYTVQPGETLSQIAGREGVPQSAVTGYRSGDPNLIYPGEELSVGGVEPREPAEYSYEKALADEMGTKTPEEVMGEQPTLVEDLRKEIETAQEKREKSREDLENARVNYFNEEYEKAGLGDKKERISSIDNEIGGLREEREEAILTAKRNPNISAGVLQGEIGKITDYYNGVINNEINKRNSVAEGYNRGIDEIERKVSHRTEDLANQYGHWDSVINQATANLSTYEQALRQEMQEESLQDRWEKEMAQQRELAQLRTSGGEEEVKLVARNRYDERGKVVGTDWYNPYTAEIVRSD